jgi:hypothetical protein
MGTGWARFFCAIVAVIATSVGMLAFLGPLMLPAMVPNGFRNLEFPLSGITSVALDKDGDVFVGLASSQRIQVYDPSGRFMRGWFVDANGGSFQVYLDEEADVYIYSIRRNEYIKYLTSGIRMGRASQSDLPSTKGAWTQNSLPSVSDNFFGTEIVVPAPTNRNTQVRIGNDFLHSVLRSPFPAWLYIVIGIAVFNLSRRKASPPPPSS